MNKLDFVFRIWFFILKKKHFVISFYYVFCVKNIENYLRFVVEDKKSMI